MTSGRILALILLPAASAASAAQRLGGASADDDVSIIRVVLSLTVCLAIGALALFLLRQRLGGSSPRLFDRLRPSSARLQVVESRRIGLQSELCIARCDDEEYLLLLTAGGPLLLRQRGVGSGEGAAE